MTTALASAVKSLLRNRLQALLTLCGMSVGVAMVVIVSGLGLGAHRKIEAQLESAGPTLITIRASNFIPAGAVFTGQEDSSGGEIGQGGGFTGLTGSAEIGGAVLASSPAVVKKTRFHTPATPLGEPEVELLKTRFPDIRAVAAAMNGNVSLAPDAHATVNVVHLHGFDPAWPGFQGWKLASGRWITEHEHAAGAPVALLTAAAADRLWPGVGSPLGQILKFEGHAVQVVGTLALPGSPPPTIIPAVYVPLRLARALLGRDSYDVITVRASSVEVTSRVASEIAKRLRVLHHLPDDTFDDFRVVTQSAAAMPSMGLDPRMVRSVHSNIASLDMATYEELARSLRKSGQTFELLLAGAAAVSLLVGGIGVMNIMLVSVTSRTREIGLRMAVGARAGDVLTQFLLEAITLAVLGGIIGLGLGALGLAGVRYSLHWAIAISLTMLALALLMAALTGAVFGYGPARRAAILDPVLALRSE